MGRRIVTKSDIVPQSGLESGLESTETVQMQPDGYFDKVIKYIPGDIVAGWTTLLGLTGGVGGAAVSGIGGIAPTIFLILLIAFIALTAWWTHQQTKDPKAGPGLMAGRPATTQIIISTVAFLVWAFALGRPFDQLLPGLYNPQVAAGILIIYTLAVGRIDPRQ